MESDSSTPNHSKAQSGTQTVEGVSIDPFSGQDAPSIYQLSVSGPHGLRGRDGQSHLHPAGRGNWGKDGAPGVDGDPGREGSHGTAAGSIELSLSLSQDSPTSRWGLPYDGEVQLSAQAAYPNQRRKQLRADLDLPFNGEIHLAATGGNGGRGGDGGKGQDGGRGANGRNATRMSNGSNGGDGGVAGDGGDGGTGGHAGHGGSIDVVVPAGQEHLLILAKGQVQGGDGGDGGQGGGSGSGGRGGRGGSSYSWRESAGTDSNGNRQYRTRSNSGGFNGSAGSKGSRGYQGREGQDGRNGNFSFKAGNTEQAFAQRYALQLVDYEFQDAYDDHILEPGERIYIKRLTVRNTGKMPLPSKRHVYLLIRNNQRILSDPLALKLPTSLGPGQSYTFTEELSLVFRRPTAQEITHQPFKATALLDPAAIMGGVQKSFDEAHLRRELPIRFPVEISPLQGHHSIGKGQATRIAWTVTNVSSHNLGQSSSLKREIETFFHLDQFQEGNALAPEHILLFDEGGRQIKLEEGFDQIIALLNAHSTEKEPDSVLEQIAFIGIHPDAKAMTTARSLTELRFAHPDEVDALEMIQFSPFQIRVAKKYNKTPGSDILLVINKDTHVATVEDVLGYYQQMGSQVDIWDISHYGLLDLEHRQENGKTLMQDFEGKTILVINNGYSSNQSDEIYSHQLLDKRQFLKGTNDYGITFYVIGQTRKDRLNIKSQLNFPTIDAQSVSYFDSRKDLKKALEKRVEESIQEDDGVLSVPLGDVAGDVDNFSNRSFVWRVKSSFWRRGSNSAEGLEKQAKKLLTYLEKEYPREQFFAVVNWTGKSDGRDKDEWSTVTVRQAPHRIHGGRMVTINANEKSLVNGSFFRGADAPYHLALGLTIWESQEALKTFLNQDERLLSDGHALNAFYRACMYHIASEQANLRMHSWTRLSRKELEKNLVFLKMITSFSLQFNGPDSPQAQLFARIFATTLALVQVQHYKLNWLFPRHRNLRLTRIVRTMIAAWVERNFDTSDELKGINPRLWEKNEADKKIYKTKIEALHQKLVGQVKGRFPKWRSRGDAYLKTFLEGVEGGEQLENRVFEQREWDALQLSDEGLQRWLDRFEDNETSQIQALTFAMEKVEMEGKTQWQIQTEQNPIPIIEEIEPFDMAQENAVESPTSHTGSGPSGTEIVTD